MKTVISNPCDLEIGRQYTLSTPHNSKAEWVGGYLTGTLEAPFDGSSDHASLYGRVGPFNDMKTLGKIVIQNFRNPGTNIVIHHNSFTIPIGIWNDFVVELINHHTGSPVVAKAYLQVLLGFKEQEAIERSDLDISIE